MRLKYFSVWMGGFLLLIGLISFVPFLVSEPPSNAPQMFVTSARGQLFGFLPVNSLLNIVHALMGIVGLYAFSSNETSKNYAQWCAGIFGAMSVLGMLPFSRTFAGLLPLYSHNIWFHGLAAIISSYFATRKLAATGAGETNLGAYREGRKAGQERKPSDLDKAG